MRIEIKYKTGNLFLIFFLLAVIGVTISCKQKVKIIEEPSVYIDHKFNDLFTPDSGGITGADGIFSVSLPDGSSAFLMGDCFLGVVKNGRRDIKTKMMNNSFIVINKNQDKARAIYKGTYSNPESIIVPSQQDDTTR